MNGKHTTCYRCHRKWAQKGGMCRLCGREAGLYRDQPMQDVSRGPIQREVPPPRTRIIEGVEYEIVFDGTVSA